MSQPKKLLITGAKGFLGSNTAKYFKSIGYETFGIGHGKLTTEELLEYGLDHWKESDISVDSILYFETEFDVIVHCGGSGSVGYSNYNPYEDFKKTVDGTLEVLEFIRLHSQNTQLIYPSSPAVQGEHPDSPINENYEGKPCSPYGYHKKIVENLCRSYSEKFGLKITIIRLFSVYGIGLKKQLLWDAIKKIELGKLQASFWGTGDETRDFIHVDDVVGLFLKVLSLEENFMILNGGTGAKKNISEVLNLIKKIMNSSIDIVFNGKVNDGNPLYYCASQKKIMQTYDMSYKVFEEGLTEYVDWARQQKN
jgi:UDP-glucose 4-epimerase